MSKLTVCRPPAYKPVSSIGFHTARLLLTAETSSRYAYMTGAMTAYFLTISEKRQSTRDESMQQTVIPNLYQLSGQHLHVSYSTTSLDGRPILTYQDAHQGKSFRGDEIRVMECDLGVLASVTLRMTPDLGSTSFSLFIPRMRIAQGTSATVHTHCVTTLHSFSIAPQLSHGQLDTYGTLALHGTAQFVIS